MINVRKENAILFIHTQKTHQREWDF